MPDLNCSTSDLECHGQQFAVDSFSKVAQSAAEFAGEILANALTWWVQTPSANPDTEAVRIAQGYTMPVVVIILVCSILAQAIRMVITRKMTPALDLGMGIVRYVVVTTMGLMLLGAAVLAGDAFSQWLMEHSIPVFVERMKNSLSSDAIDNSFGLLVLAVIAVILSAVQWLIAFFRQAGILVLATLLPLAASGSLSQSGKQWLTKMIPTLLSLVAYKPLAALIYTIGFLFVGHAKDMTTTMSGIMVLVMGVVALPAMMRFFSWAGVNISGGGGAVGGALGSFAGSQMGGGGGGSPSGAADQDTAVQSSSRMETSGPNSGGDPSGAGTSGSSGSGQTGPDGAATGGGAESAAGAGEAAGGAGAAGSAGSGAAASGAAGGAAVAGPAGAVAAGTVAAAGEVKGAADGAADEMSGGQNEQ